MLNSENVAVIVLNYLTTHEPAALLESFYKLFPSIPVFIVDNGSPKAAKKHLNQIIERYPYSQIIHLEKNHGFARGMNFGIENARRMGFEFIVVSNSDITFHDSNLFSGLLGTYKRTGCAVVGPDILTPNGVHQNPFLEYRPTSEEALNIYRGASLTNITKRFLSNKIKHSFGENIHLTIRSIYRKATRAHSPLHDRSCFNREKEGIEDVYALHGAFLMFCPPFFRYYAGFFDKTFLYGEELILAEQVLSKNMKIIYNSSVSVLHHEDATSNLLWGGEDRLKPSLIASKSTKCLSLIHI